MKSAHAMPMLAMLAAVAAQTGCFWVTTKHEGELLRQDVDTVQAKVSAQDETLSTKVKKLEEVLEKATQLLTRNSADLGAEVSGLVRDGAELRGLVTEATRYTEEVKNDIKILEMRQQEIEKRLAVLEQKVTAPPAQSADQLYSQAKAAFDDKELDKADKLFTYLIIKFPGHDRADDAQYYRGELRYRKGDYETAIGEFQRVFDKYPKSALADDALFRAGEAAVKLKWCTDARAYFNVLMQKYPKSSLAKKAKTEDRTLKAHKGKKKYCKS